MYEKIIQSQFQLGTPEQIRGCSELEITKLEQAYNELYFPYSYKVFLKYFGRCCGRVGNDLEFTYPNILSLTQYEKEIIVIPNRNRMHEPEE